MNKSLLCLFFTFSFCFEGKLPLNIENKVNSSINSIIGIMVEFQYEEEDDPNTTGNGHFLINQIDNPVRWLETIQNMKNNRITNFIEVGPKNILTKLNKNIVPQIDTLNVEEMEIFKKLNV